METKLSKCCNAPSRHGMSRRREYGLFCSNCDERVEPKEEVGEMCVHGFIDCWSCQNSAFGMQSILPSCCGGKIAMSCKIHSKRPNCLDCENKKGNCGNHLTSHEEAKIWDEAYAVGWRDYAIKQLPIVEAKIKREMVEKIEDARNLPPSSRSQVLDYITNIISK